MFDSLREQAFANAGRGIVQFQRREVKELIDAYDTLQSYNVHLCNVVAMQRNEIRDLHNRLADANLEEEESSTNLSSSNT